MKSEVIYQLIAFAHEEGGSLGLIGLHDDYRAGSIAVIGDVEVGDVDISLADSLQDAVEAARGISHLDAGTDSLQPSVLRWQGQRCLR